MKKIFISNAEVQVTKGADFIFIQSEGIEQLNEQIIKFNNNIDNTVYVIDVHYTFNGAKKMQHQGGVIIYRHLLSMIKNSKEEKLKVVFYSPIPKIDLVKLKPENYILNLLPFIELFPTKDKNGNDIKEWTFEGALDALEEEIKNCPQLNNASENLLSGWALANKDLIKKGLVKEAQFVEEAQIDLKEKKLFIIEDEMEVWKNVYIQIFKNDFTKIGKYKFGQNLPEVLKKILNSQYKFDFVLSDFYLTENHKDTIPYKTQNDIKKISGFDFFKKIKDKFPYIPYMVYTTSNKVWNAEMFFNNGVWAWSVKDNNSNLKKDDKIAQYDYFKQGIDKITNIEYQFVADIWKVFMSFLDNNSYWWKKIPGALRFEDIKEIFEECLTTLESIYSKRSSYDSKQIKNYEARQILSIFSNLGGLSECFKLKYDNSDSGENQRTVGVYIFRLRSFYSHSLNYKYATPIEAIFCLDLMLKLFSMNSEKFNEQLSINIIRISKFDNNSNLNFLFQFIGVLNKNSNNEIKLSYNKPLLTYLFKVLIKKLKKIKEVDIKKILSINRSEKYTQCILEFIKKNDPKIKI